MNLLLIITFLVIPISFFAGWIKGYNQAYSKYNK